MTPTATIDTKSMDPTVKCSVPMAALTMTVPLMILAAITIVAGWILPFGHFVSSDGKAYDIHIDTGVAAISLVVALFAIGLATYMYARSSQPLADSLARRFSGLHKAAYRRFYLDEIWLFVTKKIIFNCISTPIAWFDRHVIDNFMNMLAAGTQACGTLIRPVQTGKIQTYTIWFFAGIIILTVILLLAL